MAGLGGGLEQHVAVALQQVHPLGVRQPEQRRDRAPLLRIPQRQQVLQGGAMSTLIHVQDEVKCTHMWPGIYHCDVAPPAGMRTLSTAATAEHFR